jgi:hypothetical protein
MFPSDDCNYCTGSALSLQRLIQCGRLPQAHPINIYTRYNISTYEQYSLELFSIWGTFNEITLVIIPPLLQALHPEVYGSPDRQHVITDSTL